MTPTGLLRLETERLVLRVSEPSDGEVFRTLWTERDPRVPPHRRIGPTVDRRWPTSLPVSRRLRRSNRCGC